MNLGVHLKVYVYHIQKEILPNRICPDSDNNELMQQLVQAVKHPIGFACGVSESWNVSGQASLRQVDNEMRHRLSHHQIQGRQYTHAKKKEAQPHQYSMHHAVQYYGPQLFPVCLRPDHNGQGQAEICQIMTDKQRNKEYEAIHFVLYLWHSYR